MAFQVSPGVNVSEIDLTAVVPAVSVSVGAVAGVFRWGPVNERVLISNEKQLVQTFGKPITYYLQNDDSAYASPWTNHETFFSAANFLGYSNALYVTRTTGGDRIESIMTLTAAVGATDATITATAGTFANLRVGDEIELAGTASSDGFYRVTGFDSNIAVVSVVGLIKADGAPYQIVAESNVEAVVTSDARVAFSTNFAAKYPGKLGNSLTVSYCSTDSNGVSEFNAVQSTKTLKVGAFDQSKTGRVEYFNTKTEAEAFADVGDDLVLSDGNRLTIQSIIGKQDTNDQGQVVAPTGGGTLTIYNGDANEAVEVFTPSPTSDITFGVNTITSATLDFSALAPGDVITISGSATTGNNKSVVVSEAAGNTITVVGNTVFTAGLDANAITIVQRDFTLDLGTETFTIVSHGLIDGQGITYSTGGGANNAIGGLVANTTYFAIVIDANTFRLAATYEDATAETPVAINITSFGSVVDGTFHSFEKETQWYAEVVFDILYSGATDYNDTFSVQWADSGLFLTAPRPNHVHVVVRDADGSVTGVANTILETYGDVSTQVGATNLDGSSNYLLDLLEANSNYVTALGDDEAVRAQSIANLTASANSEAQSLVLGYDGDDEVGIPIGDLVAGYDLYKDAADVDISLVIQGKARGAVLANYLTNNIAESRKDCVVFVSPEVTDVTSADVVEFSQNLSGSTYMVVDTGYKYQYDKYNDVYRWIPLNADIAGLCARTDNTRDPWWSPAGLNRGVIKNVVKLRFNPTKAERDLLYVNGVNPVITQPGSGTILFGDKTFSPIASAFDRINVRRLFIVLEKAISAAAKSLLFEFNDEFTRAQFKNLVEPFLREVQGRRGIYDFKVVCDETNNTPEVIDGNQFVGDIFIKPARSINYIQLNFVAVRTGVEFEEIVGAV